LEILDRITEIAPPAKDADVVAALAAIRSEFPTVTDFEREFPSLCFALATGVGKTRLMGAFVSYLHMAHGIDNFFVLAPNLTIYNKLIADFTPGNPKYVFQGIADFATHPPEIITGDNYEQRVGTLFDELARCKVNIFNISKINSEVRGGRSPRIKRLSEYIGESYFDYLAGLPNLVLLMDESHRYRASAGVRAINELKPSLGLELTATPYVETPRGPVVFKNVIFDYPLARAMEDGFVKEPAVVTRKNLNTATMQPTEIERIKLDDGVRLHEQTKVELETYARENELPIVKPFVLVIARDTTHAGQLMALVKSVEFFNGRYAEKVLQVDSSRTGADEDAMVEGLLSVEHPENPIEIVIHVNMLKEGWDVTNLYTIVPLRAANARVLIEQSIGRGLRLPYGKRTGVASVDRLNIVAHDKFQEIVDEANRPDSIIRLQTRVLDDGELHERPKTVVAQPILSTVLGFRPVQATAATEVAVSDVQPAFTTPQDQAVAQIAYRAMQRVQSSPSEVPSVAYLRTEEVQRAILREVEERYKPEQGALEGIGEKPDLAAVIAKTTELVISRTIDIPRISVIPRSEVRSGFRRFTLELAAVTYPAPSDDIYVHYLRTGGSEIIGLGAGMQREARLEDHIVRRLVDFNDVAYDSHSDMLYDLAGQVVAHLRGYLDEEDTRKVLVVYGRDIGSLVHSQMQGHYWEDEVEYDVVVSRGFTDLKDSAYTQSEATMDFRQSPADKSNMAKYLFGGFSRCLYPVAKFQAEQERILAVILERDAQRWFRPAKGQFQLYYRSGPEHLEYQPDFVAETENTVYMLEPKARNQLDAADVQAKKAAAILWCERASAHAATCGGKPWRYALIPHDRIATNMTIEGLVSVAVQ
jgi:type III restriction enzyme